MTTRQQMARLLPLVLLVVLIIAGLRGAVPAPRWTGPLRADGVAIGIALEVVFGVLLAVVRVREAAARRAAQPASLCRTGPGHRAAAGAAVHPVLRARRLHGRDRRRAHRQPAPALLHQAAAPAAAQAAQGRAHAAAASRLGDRRELPHPGRPDSLRAAHRRAHRGGRGQRLVVHPAAPAGCAAGHRGREHGGTARGGGRGQGGARPGRRRQGRDHRLLRGDGTQPGGPGHGPHGGRHPRRAARPGGRGGDGPRWRGGPPHRAVLRGALLHPPARRRPAGRGERGTRRTRARAGQQGRKAGQAPGKEQAARPGGGWV